ncbi:hypothetical protein GOP47_0019408 [Adiantum capillus-veneris]|uniref:Sec23/sec24 transport family protein n=1 Tax=Adiantum capillus-veneris TaxID=13818 RepID=A0A9D4UBZ3_ADICA|nr:hypothetical protein GOP47_0019408 [Adiantum capillus-veneris]
MAVRLSVSKSPVDPKMQDGSGVPWGAALTPFSAHDEKGIAPVFLPFDASHLPRCDTCYAYLSSLCEIEQYSWRCAVCDSVNSLSEADSLRYSSPQNCPELSSSFIDMQIPEGKPCSKDDFQGQPVFVAAVDLSASEEFLELIKSALLAALEALEPGVLFGLATFSHKIGLYDIQGPIPVVKNVVIPPELDGHVPVELEDAMPLRSFLAPVEKNKDNIAAALETLKPTSSWERTTAAGQGIEGVTMGGRGFGVAMDAILNYLGAEHGVTFAIARVFAFLSGPPDYGAGQLDTRRYGEQYASKGEDADKALLPEQTPFYKDLAGVAVQAGVCVDIFAVTDEYTDLASLKFLSIDSGGSLFLYANTDDATLPQDLYRMLSRPYAFGCIYKLRTSPELKISQSYGHFFPDPQYENVQHIICCDVHATYAYDFEFTSSSGFDRTRETLPSLQMAFQYTVMVPCDSQSQSDLQIQRKRFTLQRRLRVRSIQIEVARNLGELYESADSEVILSILTHKIIHASLEEGIKEARTLLHDWLIILTAQYNDFCKLARFGQSTTMNNLDVTFSHYPKLQVLPRLVFALMRSSLLRPHEEGVHPDYRIYLQCLFSALEPSSLLRAVYPVLSSYSSPDKQAFPRHSLSRAALITSSSPIFFLDAFTVLIVYYTSTSDPALPFPPPQNCLLRSTINKLKWERSITPKLIMIREGHDRTEPFDNYLIEEQDADGTGIGNGMGLVAFLDHISQNVRDYMR